jgi:hypothetical protein
MSLAEIQSFRGLREEFAKAAFDDLYRRWYEGGPVAIEKAAGSSTTRLECELRVHRLRFSYGPRQISSTLSSKVAEG